MKTYSYDLYTITTKSNLHVGAGDNNFGIIDKQVQRDSITNLPVVNSSSLKGALREYFKDLSKDIKSCTYPESETKDERTFINFVFGGDSKQTDKDSKESKTQDSSAGTFKFMSASLLAIPIRSKDKPYHLVTAPMIVDMLKDIKKDFSISSLGLTEDKPIDKAQGIILEDQEIKKYKKITTGILKDTIMIENGKFLELIETLPFIPRNHLENGVSKNLFYEEVVPRESKFFFCVGKPNEEIVSDIKKSDKFIECFDRYLKDNIVQIGANASIGYGLCKVEQHTQNRETGVKNEQADK